MSAIDNDWLPVMEDEFKKDYYKKLYEKIREEYHNYRIYPPADDIFNAFHMTPFSKVKVVIIGQDPYFNEGQAHGLCFSVKPGVKTPPSLVNIYKELNTDLGCRIPNNGYLIKWAQQGVFMLNSVLTVRALNPNSHKELGWEQFTDAAISALGKEDRPIVFMLWGRPARNKKKYISNNPKHLILEAPHPSPLSAYHGFFGCRHFSKANEFLKENGLSEIDWQIEDI